MEEVSLCKKYTNIEVTLIDYTLSRATLSNGEVLANAMKDKSIFDQHIKDPRTSQQHDDNQQYEMYRKMRRLVVDDRGDLDEDGAWQSFIPQTNILWLYHILTILLRSCDKQGRTSRKVVRCEASIGKRCNGERQPHDHPIITNHVESAELEAIAQLLEIIKEDLDPYHDAGPQWESAKDLLECDQYWIDAVREGLDNEV